MSAHSFGAVLDVYLRSTIGALFAYLLLSAIDHGLLFIKKLAPSHAKYQPNQKENRKAVLVSAINIFLAMIPATPIQYGIAHGYSRLYDSISLHGWWYYFASIFICLFISETGIYWIHRALHMRFLIKTVHRLHHEFRAPTPWVSMALNPLDAFLQGLPYHLLAYTVPVHRGTYFAMLSFSLVWSVMVHDRSSLFTRWWFNGAPHHTVHHWFQKYNYGGYFTFWDRLCGTYYSPENLPKELPDGVR